MKQKTEETKKDSVLNIPDCFDCMRSVGRAGDFHSLWLAYTRPAYGASAFPLIIWPRGERETTGDVSSYNTHTLASVSLSWVHNQEQTRKILHFFNTERIPLHSSKVVLARQPQQSPETTAAAIAWARCSVAPPTVTAALNSEPTATFNKASFLQGQWPVV